MTEDQEPLFKPNVRYTPRLRAILRAAETEAANRGYDFVGVEHVQLAILADPWAIPTQVIAREEGRVDRIAADLRGVLDSDSYKGIKPTPES
ncbi:MULTISPECIES: Clp protease N-terminal domain-containing protein [unclassified Nocardia]|uniref:Clp protease N-terminal domain-containing protein n=1 Tax=unclassified Nocardia TaxID=2637762 RepID=UPI001CE458ED|nr:MULTISPECIES: Clp protease N-terminal domain-containing protein [unclassified Nocardia]